MAAAHLPWLKSWAQPGHSTTSSRLAFSKLKSPSEGQEEKAGNSLTDKVHKISCNHTIYGANASSLLAQETLDQFSQRLQFRLLDQIEFLDEEDEVLERGIEMRFGSQQLNLAEVCVIDMCVDSEQPLEDILHDIRKCPRERNANFGREDLFVIKLFLHPGHQVINIFRSGAFDGLLNVLACTETSISI